MKSRIVKMLFVIVAGLIATSSFAQVSEGIKAAKSGDYVKAVNLMKSGIGSESGYDANYYYGLALFKTGAVKQAETYLNKALKADEEGVEALMTLGNLYSSKRDYDKANGMYKKALAEEPENKSVLFAQAENFTRAGKVDEAITTLTFARTLAENDPSVYVGLGDAYYYRRAFNPSLENYQKALKLNPKSAPAMFGIGQVFFRQKKYNDALEMFKKSVESDRNFAKGYLELGRLYYFNENYPNALDAFQKYSQLMPGSIEGETYIAKTLYGQKKYDEALAKLENIIAKNPNEDLSSAYKYLAYVYHDKDEFDKSLQYFEKVDPEIIDIEDHIMLAKIYAGKKDYDNAYKNINEAIGHDSTSDNNYYELGVIQFGEKKYEDAIKSFDKAIELGSNQIATYVYKGLSLYSLKSYNEAVTEFDRAIALDDEFVQAWLWKARTLLQLDKVDDARKCYDKVLALDPNNSSAKDDLNLLDGKQ